MNEKEKKELFARILKRDRLSDVKRLAENGNAVCCKTLGEIFFYGIDTDDKYLRDLEYALVLMGHSGILKVDEYVEKNIRPKFENFAIICKCTKEPQYEEALKWYKMALKFGEKKAEEKILKIQEILSKGNKDASEGERKKKQIMQMFKINEKEG